MGSSIPARVARLEFCAGDPTEPAIKSQCSDCVTHGSPPITNDAVTVAKEIELRQKFENMRAQGSGEVATGAARRFTTAPPVSDCLSEERGFTPRATTLEYARARQERAGGEGRHHHHRRRRQEGRHYRRASI
jgi:hypothetical protein